MSAMVCHQKTRTHRLFSRIHRSIPASHVSDIWEFCGLGLPCPRPADVVTREAQRTWPMVIGGPLQLS